MCRSDSAADTRDSENTFPASLADEKKGRNRENHTEAEKKQKQVQETERRKLNRMKWSKWTREK